MRIDLHDAWDAVRLLELLETANKTLATLTLGITAHTNESAVPLRNAIQNIGSLKSLELHCEIPLEDNYGDDALLHSNLVKLYLEALLGGVSHHRASLSNVVYVVGSFLESPLQESPHFGQLLLEKEIADELRLLESSLEKGDNRRLTNFTLKHHDRESDIISVTKFAKIDFYTKLNEIDFAKLQSCPDNREDWVNSLVEKKDNAEIVFHLMQTNPSVYFSTPREGALRREQNAQMQKKRKANAM